MAEVTWSPSAKADLLDIVDRIADDSVIYAQRFCERIDELVLALVNNPLMGHPVPEFKTKGLRQVNIGDYRLIYRVVPEGLQIVRLFHSARLLRIVHLK